jgi:hypothetical protein
MNNSSTCSDHKYCSIFNAAFSISLFYVLTRNTTVTPVQTAKLICIIQSFYLN